MFTNESNFKVNPMIAPTIPAIKVNNLYFLVPSSKNLQVTVYNNGTDVVNIPNIINIENTVARTG